MKWQNKAWCRVGSQYKSKNKKLELKIENTPALKPHSFFLVRNKDVQMNHPPPSRFYWLYAKWNQKDTFIWDESNSGNINRALRYVGIRYSYLHLNLPINDVIYQQGSAKDSWLMICVPLIDYLYITLLSY